MYVLYMRNNYLINVIFVCNTAIICNLNEKCFDLREWTNKILYSTTFLKLQIKWKLIQIHLPSVYSLTNSLICPKYCIPFGSDNHFDLKSPPLVTRKGFFKIKNKPYAFIFDVFCQKCDPWFKILLGLLH